MKLYPIETGNFKLDGGAMFGVVPKSIWQKQTLRTAKNLIDLGMRCLLIEDGKTLFLLIMVLVISRTINSLGITTYGEMLL